MQELPEYDLNILTPGHKCRAWITVGPRAEGGMWRLPVLAVAGQRPGPTLAILGGVHGDEYEGMTTIPRLFDLIDPAEVAGTVVMVPVCNVPAYEAALRSSPVDELNLARVFPGRAGGSVTERIAYLLTDKVIARADFLLDFHSAGVAYDIPTLIGYIHDAGELGQKTRAAAAAFGAPVIWGHPLPLPPGRSISAATELGIPSLYTEAAGGGFARDEDLEVFVTGAQRLMVHLGMMAGELPPAQAGHHLVGDGNLDYWLDTAADGIFHADVRLLEAVVAGQRLGHVRDVMGQVVAEVTAPADGVVILLRRLQRVNAGDGLAQITQTLAQYENRRAE